MNREPTFESTAIRHQFSKLATLINEIVNQTGCLYLLPNASSFHSWSTSTISNQPQGMERFGQLQANPTTSP